MNEKLRKLRSQMQNQGLNLETYQGHIPESISMTFRSYLTQVSKVIYKKQKATYVPITEITSLIEPQLSSSAEDDAHDIMNDRSIEFEPYCSGIVTVYDPVTDKVYTYDADREFENEDDAINYQYIKEAHDRGISLLEYIG